jgi:hypothetical protein
MLTQLIYSFNNLTTRRTDLRYLTMDLKQVIKRVEEYGNSKIACNWDNVLRHFKNKQN